MTKIKETKEQLKIEIDRLETQIKDLSNTLLNFKRQLWWLQRPHIYSFVNDFCKESDDEGGSYPVWQPYTIVLSKEWLKDEPNQKLIKEREAELEEDGYSFDYIICGLNEDTELCFDEDPYPDFDDWSIKTVRNPNYAS